MPVQAAESLRFEVSGFALEGELPMPEAEAQALLRPYTGPAVTIEQLQDAASALEEALAARGHAFYSVALPPQALQGVVRLRVLKFRLANVNVSGNTHFSTANVIASLPSLRKGESPNVAEVARNRAAANDHPAKEVQVTFRRSEVPDSVNAEIGVRDQAPQSVFLGVTNTGTRRTGNWRTTLGYQHSNLWNRDHALTATYTVSPDHTGDVSQYGLYYRVPFYAVGGALTVLYAYSDVNSGIIANAFNVSGRGEFAGLQWKQHLVPRGAYSHALEIGLDDRHFQNSVIFGSTQLGVDVRSRPLTLGYQGRYSRTDALFGGAVQYVRNLGGGSANGDPQYSANRAGATRGWNAWRYTLDAVQRFAPWTLSARLRGQYSGAPLIAGEQFGLGGAQSVRGLREREATGDTGFTATLEGALPLPWEGASFIVFSDAGEVRSKSVPAGVPAREGAASAGVGLRWVIDRRASLALDAAQVIDGTAASRAGDRRVHLSLVVRF